MAVIAIEQVQGAPNPEVIAGFALDIPLSGSHTEVYDIDLAGWVVGRAARAKQIEIHSGDRLLRRIPIDHVRKEIAQRYPNDPQAAVCGFRTSVNVVGLEPNAPLKIFAVLEGRGRHLLAQITYTRQLLATGYTPRLRPMMLTTLGRAGTTWTMRLLSEHPEMVIHRAHPYELRVARHWLHSFKILTEPRDPYHSAHADTFQNSLTWAGHNPFYPQPLGLVPAARQWFGKTYVEEYAAASQRWIDECYTQIASGQGITNPVYFGEKHRPDNLPWLVWELYPQAKEIFLVRDFRDLITSMLSFNAKHGRQIFGPPQPVSDEDFVRFTYKGPIRNVVKGWEKRRDRAMLIRYEDLIQEPEPTLKRILTYLELDTSDAVISGMLARASAENPLMLNHRTSSEVAKSIGRWRTSLSPSAQAACAEVLGPVLEQFDYAV